VVEIDRVKAERNNQRMAWIYAAIAFLGAGLVGAGGALVLAVLTETATEDLSGAEKSALVRNGLFVVVIGLVIAVLWGRTALQLRRMPSPNDVALRLTPRGVHTGMAGEPDAIFVPWNLVRGFAEKRVGPRRTHLLVMTLVASSGEGAVGLDRPDVQRMVKLLGGIAWPAALLRQPLSEIEAARARLVD
jgi:hypothetical protein